MSQTFGPSANTIARTTLAGGVCLVGGALALAMTVQWSPYVTRRGVVAHQPIPFSHEHHVSGLGIDCRYCHTSVEQSSFAGLPTTQTCMNCHSQVWAESFMLEPVRRSWRTGEPIAWVRVHDLPDHVQFNHSIHVAKGIGCATCHGRVDQMPLTYKATPMTMGWCLECHRDPGKFIQPRETVFDMAYVRPPDEGALGRELMERYQVHPVGLTDCTTCHR